MGPVMFLARLAAGFRKTIILVLCKILAIGAQTSHAQEQTTDGHADNSTTTLAEMIDNFASSGLTLNEGISQDHIVQVFSEAQIVSAGYSLLLFAFGTEVEIDSTWMPISDRVADFDMEGVYGNGSYVEALRTFAQTAGVEKQLSEASDDIDLSQPIGELSYVLGGNHVRIQPKIDSDWFDPNSLTKIAKSIESVSAKRRRFWYLDNGQAFTLTFLSDSEAAALNGLEPGLLKPYTW